jgi:diguanylate cyclase (GGDEF)-like protein
VASAGDLISLSGLSELAESVPVMGKALAAGGFVAGCTLGAVALGPLGLLLAAAAQALAFAGGLLMSRQAHKQLEEANQKLLEQATTDPLTGLRNRRAIFQILEDELERCRKQRASLAVILSDIDHFKKINDTYGHPVGDAVLAEVARRVAMAVRAVDSPGRYGGEEMMVVLPGSGTTDAFAVAERIRTSVSSQPILTYRGALHVTLSLGVAGTDLVGHDDLQALVSAADEALYRAKNRGRNRVELAGKDLSSGWMMAQGA